MSTNNPKTMLSHSLATEDKPVLDKDGSPIIDLQKKITVFAPKGAAHFNEGEAAEIHPAQLDNFLAKGFTEATGAAKKGSAKAE